MNIYTITRTIDRETYTLKPAIDLSPALREVYADMMLLKSVNGHSADFKLTMDILASMAHNALKPPFLCEIAGELRVSYRHAPEWDLFIIEVVPCGATYRVQEWAL